MMDGQDIRRKKNGSTFGNRVNGYIKFTNRNFELNLRFQFIIYSLDEKVSNEIRNEILISKKKKKRHIK